MKRQTEDEDPPHECTRAVQKDKKLPAMQFYPGDWRKDIGVQSLSFHDRGIWFEMLMLMHDSERRGVLVLNEQPMSEAMIARAIGLDNQTFNQTLTTLLNTGVASREQGTGAVMNRRMVRDERMRKIKAACGAKGGNPALLNQSGTSRDKQNQTPSFSNSLSISEEKTKTPAKATPSPDSRAADFKSAFQEAFQAANGIAAPWDAKEASNLARFLKVNPTIALEQWRRILYHRDESPLNHKASLSTWVSLALAWLDAPADQWGKPIAEGNRNGYGNRGQQRTDSNLAAARRAAEAIISRASSLAGGDSASNRQ